MSKPTDSSTPYTNLPKWNTTMFNANDNINREISMAYSSRRNLRPFMKTLAGIPFDTSAISFQGHLTEWLNSCKSIFRMDRDDSFLRVSS